MSGKSKADYVAVLEHVRDTLPSPPEVRGTLLDFEKAAWLAIMSVFGVRVKVMGCTFHLNKAIFGRIKQLGMQQPYNTDRPTRVILQEVDGFALPTAWTHSASVPEAESWGSNRALERTY